MHENFRCFIAPTELQKELLCYSDAMGFDSSPEFFIDRESFNDYLIMYTIYGKLWCKQNGKEIAIGSGEAVFLDLHHPHKYYFEKGTPTKIAWIALNGSPVAAIAQQILANTELPFSFRLPDLYQEMLSFFELSDCPDPDIFRQSQQCYSFLLQILKESYCQSPNDQKNISQNDFKKSIWDMISHNLHRNLTVEDLAQSVSLSKYHFIRTFRAAFGMSPMHFVTEEKIRQAKYQLTNTTDTIANISESLGFENAGYFSKVFKHATGISPSAYRKYGPLSKT